MKKTNIIAIAAIAAVFVGSIAQAGSLGNINRADTIPGFKLPALTQCEFDRSNLRGQLTATQSELTESQDQVRELEDQIQILKQPGSCEDRCFHPDVTDVEFNACAQRCRAPIRSDLSRWF